MTYIHKKLTLSKGYTATHSITYKRYTSLKYGIMIKSEINKILKFICPPVHEKITKKKETEIKRSETFNEKKITFW